MKRMRTLLGLVVLTAFILGACSSNQLDNNSMEEPMDNSSNEMSDEGDENMSDSSHDNLEDTSDDMTEEESGNTDEMMEVESNLPLWYTYQFEDVTTSETFAISDFRGKVVLVETMAMWCSNCLAQQKEVVRLHEMLGERDDFVSVGINIDPEEDNVMVASYVEAYGFDWLYGVAPLDVYVDIGATLGVQFQNPPSVPIVLIDKDGNLQVLPFGVKDAETLLAYVEPELN